MCLYYVRLNTYKPDNSIYYKITNVVSNRSNILNN
nr:MAG TPA: hypothetical protein [Caudoviricetes sp.]